MGTEIVSFTAWSDHAIIAYGDKYEVCYRADEGTNITVAVTCNLDGDVFSRKLTANQTSCMKCALYSQGDHTVYVSAYNTFSHFNTSLSTFVEEGITGLEIDAPRSLIVNISTDIIVRFKTLGEDYCVLLDLGDIHQTDLTLHVYGVDACEGRHPSHKYIKAFGGELSFTVEHAYREVGVYTAVARAYNRRGSSQVTELIEVLECAKPVARLYGLGKDIRHPVAVYKSRLLRLEAYVENSCKIPWTINMTWTLTVWPDGDATRAYVMDIDQPNKPVLFMKPKSLPYGIITIHFHIKV